MRQNNKEIEKYRDLLYSREDYGNNGAFVIPYMTNILRVICSDQRGWEHIGVSLKNRCPNWGEMKFVKELFFDDEETVIQFHPKKSQYINNHEFCLHLWKETGVDYNLPPSEMIGFKQRDFK